MKDAKKAKERLNGMIKPILKIKDGDKLTKYQTISFIKSLEKLIDYQMPMKPKNIEVDEQGDITFQCPRCEMFFEIGNYKVEDFKFCQECGQRLRDSEE